ncbi:MAG: hypothetical protein GC171_15665 [Terrimonas sp.]|nr:hypothetical protein [Terrimonas sp.]
METGKKIAAFILLVSFMASSFYQAILVLDYRINTAAYARNCINKYKPQLHCNGQCQLMKKIQQQENKEQKSPALKLANKTEVISARTYFLLPEFLPGIEKTEYFTFSDTRTFDQPTFIFHPPLV